MLKNSAGFGFPEFPQKILGNLAYEKSFQITTGLYQISGLFVQIYLLGFMQVSMLLKSLLVKLYSSYLDFQRGYSMLYLAEISKFDSTLNTPHHMHRMTIPYKCEAIPLLLCHPVLYCHP